MLHDKAPLIRRIMLSKRTRAAILITLLFVIYRSLYTLETARTAQEERPAGSGSIERPVPMMYPCLSEGKGWVGKMVDFLLGSSPQCEMATPSGNIGTDASLSADGVVFQNPDAGTPNSLTQPKLEESTSQVTTHHQNTATLEASGVKPQEGSTAASTLSIAGVVSSTSQEAPSDASGATSTTSTANSASLSTVDLNKIVSAEELQEDLDQMLAKYENEKKAEDQQKLAGSVAEASIANTTSTGPRNELPVSGGQQGSATQPIADEVKADSPQSEPSIAHGQHPNQAPIEVSGSINTDDVSNNTGLPAAPGPPPPTNLTELFEVLVIANQGDAALQESLAISKEEIDNLQPAEGEYLENLFSKHQAFFNKRLRNAKSEPVLPIIDKLRAFKLQAIFGDCDHEQDSQLFKKDNQVGEEEPEPNSKEWESWCTVRGLRKTDAMREFMSILSHLLIYLPRKDEVAVHPETHTEPTNVTEALLSHLQLLANQSITMEASL